MFAAVINLYLAGSGKHRATTSSTVDRHAESATVARLPMQSLPLKTRLIAELPKSQVHRRKYGDTTVEIFSELESRKDTNRKLSSRVTLTCHSTFEPTIITKVKVILFTKFGDTRFNPFPVVVWKVTQSHRQRDEAYTCIHATQCRRE